MSIIINREVALKRVDAYFTVECSVDAETGAVTATVVDFPSSVEVVTEDGDYDSLNALPSEVERLLENVEFRLSTLLGLFPNP
jgi:hypothetical protein